MPTYTNEHLHIKRLRCVGEYSKKKKYVYTYTLNLGRKYVKYFYVPTIGAI